METGKRGVLEHLDVPFMPVQDGQAYWEGITIMNMGLMMHNHPYFFTVYGSGAMPVIAGKCLYYNVCISIRYIGYY